MTDNEWFKAFILQLEKQMRDNQENNQRQLKEIHECIEKVPQILERKYVSKQEFQPVRLISYGIAGISLTALLLMLLKVVLTR